MLGPNEFYNSGVVTVEAGGQINATGSLSIIGNSTGIDTGTNAPLSTALVSGTGSVWNASGEIEVAGNGRVTVASGGAMNAAHLAIYGWVTIESGGDADDFRKLVRRRECSSYWQPAPNGSAKARLRSAIPKKTAGTWTRFLAALYN